jgi:hypothetical protein
MYFVKCRSLQKFLTAKNGLFLVRYECSFPARCKHFSLVNYTSMMNGTRLPRNNLDVPRGVRVSSCSTGRSGASKKTSFTHAICPKNKPFLAETLNAENAVAEPPKRVSAKPISLVFLRWVSC